MATGLERAPERHSPEHTSNQIFKIQSYLVERAARVSEPSTLWTRQLPHPFEEDSSVVYIEDSNWQPTMFDELSLVEGVFIRGPVYSKYGKSEVNYQHVVDHGVRVSARSKTGKRSAEGYWLIGYGQTETQLTDSETRDMAARLTWELRDVIATRELDPGPELARAS